MPKTVLIIDDEADIREIATASLQLVGGFTVLTARSGQDGISLARQQKPDAIILDLMMPEMDGCEVLLQLKNDPNSRDIPVVLLTAKVQGMKKEMAQAAGAAGVLMKPFDPMLLPAQLNAMLGWAAADHEHA
ncbi:MAG TPA: response regulator [Terriglobales bacterium]|nr:response regulator [Terriglobales bacterium]